MPPLNTNEKTVMDFKAIRRELHSRPELSGEEKETARHVESALREFEPTKIVRHVGGHGLLAEYVFAEEGPTLLFRADMDAVAMDEPADLCPHHSLRPGVAHKCGHDGHTAILLRLAQRLRETPLRRGRALLLFQPAEETGAGARAVLEEGELNDYRIDKAFALHNIPGAPLGSVLCRTGSFTCAVTSVAITLTGRPSHAAEPQNGVNPGAAAADIVRETLLWNQPDKTREDYFLATLVEIRVGEEAYGVSAGEGVIRFTLRAKTDRVLQERLRRLETLVGEACQRTTGLRHSITRMEPFSASENDDSCVALVREAARQEGLPYREAEQPFSWGEDFGLFTQHYPGALFGLGAGENCPPLHSPLYDFPDELIETGASLFHRIAALASTQQAKQAGNPSIFD